MIMATCGVLRRGCVSIISSTTQDCELRVTQYFSSGLAENRGIELLIAIVVSLTLALLFNDHYQVDKTS